MSAFVHVTWRSVAFPCTQEAPINQSINKSTNPFVSSIKHKLCLLQDLNCLIGRYLSPLQKESFLTQDEVCSCRLCVRVCACARPCACHVCECIRGRRCLEASRSGLRNGRADERLCARTSGPNDERSEEDGMFFFFHFFFLTRATWTASCLAAPSAAKLYYGAVVMRICWRVLLLFHVFIRIMSSAVLGQKVVCGGDGGGWGWG